MILAILGFVLIRPIAARLGAEGPLLDSCVRYARIVLLALPLFSMQVMFQSFFVAAEKPKLSFTVSVISGVANMALDAVLCILLPQELKLTGAAIATAVSQAVGGVIPLVYFSRENDSLLASEKQSLTDGRSERRASMVFRNFSAIFPRASSGCSLICS